MKPFVLELGIKTDPIETRYSFEWLFDLAAEEGIRHIQLGSFYELYHVDLDYFADLRAAAESRGLVITSVFTAHRELGGFFTGDPRLAAAARRGYERLIAVAAAVGARFCGSNPGAVYRDRPQLKPAGLARYLEHMRELTVLAQRAGLEALTLEPMSCLAEPPATAAEIEHLMQALAEHHRAHPATTVPTWLCADISHGLADAHRHVLLDNVGLFTAGAPWTAEFHFKNTDALFNSTFGFAPEEIARGIVDLAGWREIIHGLAARFPVTPLIGYLEIGGPKTGRDYTDPLLGPALRTSLRAIRRVFDPAATAARAAMT